MKLHGQECTAGREQRGYAMAALLVALAVMAVMLSVAMPVWRTAVKREKEAELVWRGSQYVRAIALFQRKYANAYPPNLDILVNERFLRRKYKDPLTKDGEFQLIPATAPSDGTQRPPGGPPAAAPIGGIKGVMSKSTEKSLRMFNGRTKYNEWAFTPETVLGVRAPGAGNTPNTPVRGAPGAIGAGGPGAPSRGRIGIDPSGRRGPQQPGQPPPQQPFGLPPQRPPE
jgi:type II secretory pathway pseudopilin PulG